MLKRSRALASVALVALAMGAGAAPAGAETLQEAIGLAYRTNPTLLAQRANQRALDETIVQARAALRPTISASGGVSYSHTDTDGLGVVETDGANASVSLSQDIWTAGRTARGIDAAEANVRAGRQNLRDVEQEVMTSVIQAYADVVRDMEILRIRQENITVLRRQLDESNARFEVGEITRTDVAQSEARLAQSDADLANAQAQLSVSRAAYAAVVGQAPANMAALPVLPGLPTDFDAALDVALVENPGVQAAIYALQAAEANVAQINVEGERRNVLQSVSSSFAQSLSARSTLQAGTEAVRAATVAAEGVRQEAQVGLRTTLDVLNQELELRSAQVTLASAHRNQYVAQAQLLAAMGRLGGPNLDPSIAAYDSEANYNAVRNRGGLPWDGAVEALDRVASPSIKPANDAEDAPIDTQLKSEIVRTSPGN